MRHAPKAEEATELRGGNGSPRTGQGRLPSEHNGQRVARSPQVQGNLEGQEPLKMSAFPAVLLAVGLLLVETNSTVSGRQSASLQCHVCERENSFECENPTNCAQGDVFCSTVAVRKLPHFYYVSKQCTRFCAIVETDQVAQKSFVLLKPTPFLYVKCCSQSLCNTHAVNITDTGMHYTKEAAGGSNGSGSSAGLLLVLTAPPAFLGLRLA
ncbi:Lymphocyte Antigen 6K [Manis pentadactyla]|nr:Lymphocyte Antigen 6K [Manis pentadactyla]